MFRSSNKISFMMYFKRLPDFQETNDERRGSLGMGKAGQEIEGAGFFGAGRLVQRLSMRRDSQLKISWTTCTRIIRNTTVTHITEVMPR